MAALSPDGRLIVYASERDTGLELIVSGVDLGNEELALTSDGGQNMQPEWSPDGRWIAFHSRARGGIWIVPSTGGTARQLVDFGSDPAWSPGGEQIVFASDAGGMAAQSVLWIVGRDGQDPRPLTNRGSPLGGHHDPAFEPSGQAVIFVVRRGTWNDEIWRMQLAGGELTKLVEGLVISAPRVSPDGRTLLWGGMGARGLGGLWQRSLADEQESQPRQLLTLNTGLVRAVSIASTGEVVYSVTDSDSNLWSIGTQPGAEPVKITDDNGRVTYPDYSPDGRLAFAQLVVGNPVSAWIADENGQGRQRILPDLSASFPQWAANGSKLLVRRGSPGDPDYMWVDAATRKTTPVPVDFRDAQSVKVSPDGAHAAYHVIHPDGTINVFRRPLAGGPAVQLTRDREAISYPGWSRDGRRFALEVKRRNETHIGVMSADGGPVEQLTSDSGQSWPHSWAPDNDRIAFAGQRDGVWNVWTVSARTREKQQLTNFRSGAGYVRYPSWSPRGDRIVFERSLETASVWVVQLPEALKVR